MQWESLEILTIRFTKLNTPNGILVAKSRSLSGEKTFEKAMFTTAHDGLALD